MVYFIQGDYSQMIKIGKAVNVVDRLSHFQPASPDQLTVLAVILDENDDFKYHKRFADAWSHGEWFHPSPDLLAFIGRIPESEYNGLYIRVNNSHIRPDKAVTAAEALKTQKASRTSHQLCSQKRNHRSEETWTPQLTLCHKN